MESHKHDNMAMEIVLAEYANSYITISLISLLSIFLIRHFFFSNSPTGLRLLPSPFSLPILGHLHLLGPIPHQALYKLSLRHGPLLHLRLGSVPCVVACSADTARLFLKDHDAIFSDRPESAAVKYLLFNSSSFAFAPYGPYWRFIKKLFMTDLLGNRALGQLKHVRQEELHRLVNHISSMAEQGRAFHVGGEIMKHANNIVSTMALSMRCSENDKDAETVRHVVKEVAELTGKFNLGDYIGVFEKLDLQGFKKRFEVTRKSFDELMERILKKKEEERRTKKEMGLIGGDGERVKDFLDILLDIYEDKESEIRLTMDNIKAFIQDIFIAGSDTSGITIEWALAELINHPSVLHKAVAEIDTVVGKNRLVDESDISNLPYLQAIVKETLRLHPTVPLIPRMSTEDCTVGGYDIPAKTKLFINVWAINRDPNDWKDPLRFYPERFIEGEQQATDIKGQHFHMLPFGSGRRSCPGASLALLIIHPTLATMIQCFDWKVNGPIDMVEGPGITLPRAQPLVCSPVCRLNPLPLA
ncbi:cytochrome P450 93A2-like isoform X2 [Typha latifolia]|uniref:cytochrome P450 93A2-like isoform X2 n=1 Tax=Typha latifolia TaxID=4733 RepID=UPI003C2BA117